MSAAGGAPGVSAVPLAIAAGLLLTIGGYAALLARLRAFERRQASLGARPWWFGYARDAVNLGAAGALFGLLVASGYPGPAALVLTTGVELVTYLADFTAGRLLGWRRTPWLVLALGGSLAVTLALGRGPVAATLRELFAIVRGRAPGG